jgi:hypothetical protein
VDFLFDDYVIDDNYRSTQSIVSFLNIIRPSLSQKSLRKEDFEKDKSALLMRYTGGTLVFE